MMDKQVVLVTGASSGFGREIAIELARRGHIVWGAARRLDKMQDLTQYGIHILSVDVTDEASMTACVARLIAEQGRLDVLVNNAGYGAFGALEEVPLSDARRQFDVNVFGLLRMAQLVIPQMRQQGYGRIINIASIAGHFCVPFGGWYSASKYAVEALSGGLRYELKPFGIDVVVIEPSLIKTGWDAIALGSLKAVSGGGVYAKEAAIIADGMAGFFASGLLSGPQVVAQAVAKAIQAKKPKTRYRVGRGAQTLVSLYALLPDRLNDWLTRKVMKSCGSDDR